ncbi:hypothetical protein [Capnocytophaga haemolytica]
MKTAISAEDGSFAFQDVAEGNCRIEVVSIFYEAYFRDISVTSDVSLGVVTISEKTQNLKEVTITGRRNPITPTDTGTLIEVAGSRLSNQNDVLSILNYAPSISTASGLKIFGSDDILLILDGKELHLSKDKLEQFLSKIPVKSIQTIEVIDRADVSFDTSKSGVIKINTLQKDGWTGSLS